MKEHHKEILTREKVILDCRNLFIYSLKASFYLIIIDIVIGISTLFIALACYNPNNMKPFSKDYMMNEVSFYRHSDELDTFYLLLKKKEIYCLHTTKISSFWMRIYRFKEFL